MPPALSGKDRPVSGSWIREIAGGKPLITVVIPVRQEEKHIRRCLEAVLSQDVEAPYEVLVVDGMSTDGTTKIASEIASLDSRVRLLRNPSRIVPPGMNVGIREAKGDLVVRVDGHCRIPAGYLREVLDAFRESGAECVGGLMIGEGETYWGRIIARATSTAFGMGGRRFHGRGEARYMDTVYLGAYPRRVLLELGLYDERFVRNQDDELNYRLRARGGRVYFTPRIWAAYSTRSTLWRLLIQYGQYGWWKVMVYRKHPRLIHVRHLVPTAFFVSLVMALVTAMALGGLAWALPLGLLGAYLLVGALSSLAEGMTLGELPGILVAFLAIHSAYGAGFLASFVSLPFRVGAFRA